MLAIGTKFEYYDAVWVKNEWRRFIGMMNGEKGKVLIPCYRDMDAYDLPKEFKQVQALDIGSVTFFRDLMRAINGILPKAAETEQKKSAESASGAASSNAASSNALLQRANLFLADQEFGKAEDYYNNVLDANPSCHEAYWGLLCVSRQCAKSGDLIKLGVPFNEDNDYKKAVQFAPDKIRAQYEKIAEKTLFCCHLKCIMAAERNNMLVAKKWQKHYAQNTDAGDPYNAVHQVYTESSCFSVLLPENLGAMLKLLELHSFSEYMTE